MKLKRQLSKHTKLKTLIVLKQTKRTLLTLTNTNKTHDWANAKPAITPKHASKNIHGIDPQTINDMVLTQRS